MPTVDELLQASAALHQHLCPKQVLGVRMGLLAADLLDLSLPRTDKRLLTIVETDGCFADGVSTATGCWVGHRTLRVVDYGKIAATFVDTETDRAFRVAPHPESRQRASQYAEGTFGHWEIYLVGYQRMPLDQLFVWREVSLVDDVRAIISHASARAVCMRCREEIINEREVIRVGQVLCRACAEGAYYREPARETVTSGTHAQVVLEEERSGGRDTSLGGASS
jgi:formylmethanofuran dehydrogenase subunit E